MWLKILQKKPQERGEKKLFRQIPSFFFFFFSFQEKADFRHSVELQRKEEGKAGGGTSQQHACGWMMEQYFHP